MKRIYYFFKAYRFTNVHGEALYEHCYFDTLEEAIKARQEEFDKGNDCTAIIQCGEDAQ